MTFPHSIRRERTSEEYWRSSSGRDASEAGWLPQSIPGTLKKKTRPGAAQETLGPRSCEDEKGAEEGEEDEEVEPRGPHPGMDEALAELEDRCRSASRGGHNAEMAGSGGTGALQEYGENKLVD